MEKSLLKLLCASAMITTMSGCEIVFVDNSTSSTENTSSSTSISDVISSTSELSSDSSSDSSSSDVSSGEWCDELLELMNSMFNETIPFVQLDESTLQYVDYEDDSGYPVLCIYDESKTNLLTNYGSILEGSGYEVYDFIGEETYGYDIYLYAKDNIIIQYNYYPGDAEYPAGNEIYVSLLELNEEPEEDLTGPWPAELIETYFNGVSVPAVPGVTEYVVADYMDYLGFLVMECESTADMEENYIAALEATGFTVEYDYEYEQYFALEETGSVQVDFYSYEGSFMVLLSVPMESLPNEWPAELISEYYGVSIPEPENTNVLGVDDYYNYDQTIVVLVEGDETVLEAYVALLETHNYTIEEATNEFYGECLRAVNPEKTVRVDLALSESGVIIEIGYYTEGGTETPVDPEEPSDVRLSVISEMCLSIFGTDEGTHYYDDEYACYYTVATFGPTYDIDTIYSYIVSILPDEICYAYSEEPIVDTYNGKDEYYNAFFDEAQTVVVELDCYYYSADYGYVAQISVYNFDSYFES